MGTFMGFPFGEARRNQPVELEPVNPLPPNKMKQDCGDAGIDGYTVLSRADRITDQRPPARGHRNSPEYWGPRQTDEQ
jgi:hypothetical protein